MLAEKRDSMTKELQDGRRALNMEKEKAKMDLVMRN
jgi:hypothetical protein